MFKKPLSLAVFLWVFLFQCWPRRRSALWVVKLPPVFDWHRRGFRLLYPSRTTRSTCAMCNVGLPPVEAAALHAPDPLPPSPNICAPRNYCLRNYLCNAAVQSRVTVIGVLLIWGGGRLKRNRWPSAETV